MFLKNHTFVICAYKESNYLEQCIESLLKQTYKSKIILTTSTPSEFLSSIASKYNIELYINNGEKGIAGDWNFGFSIADTDYVTIAHQDDTYHSDYLENVIISLEKAKSPLIAFTDYAEIRDGEKVFSNTLLKIKKLMLSPLRIKSFWGSKFIRNRILSLGNAICCPSVTYNKKNIKLPLFKSGYVSNLDWDAWYNLAQLKGEFVYINKPLVFHRIHIESTSTLAIEGNVRMQEDFEIFKRYWPEPIAKLIVKKYIKSEKSNKI